MCFLFTTTHPKKQVKSRVCVFGLEIRELAEWEQKNRVPEVPALHLTLHRKHGNSQPSVTETRIFEVFFWPKTMYWKINLSARSLLHPLSHRQHPRARVLFYFSSVFVLATKNRNKPVEKPRFSVFGVRFQSQSIRAIKQLGSKTDCAIIRCDVPMEVCVWGWIILVISTSL